MRVGIIFFYLIIGGSSFVEKAWPGGAEGIMLNGGRMFACIFAVIFFGSLTGTMSRAELLAQFDAPPGAPLADRGWAVFQRILIWGSLPAAAWKFVHGRIWDGIMLLALPIWAAWIKLELRSGEIQSGVLKPAAVWRLITGVSAVALTVSFVLTVADVSGPAIRLGRDYYRLYPFITLVSIPILIIAGLLSGLSGRN